MKVENAAADVFSHMCVCVGEPFLFSLYMSQTAIAIIIN